MDAAVDAAAPALPVPVVAAAAAARSPSAGAKRKRSDSDEPATRPAPQSPAAEARAGAASASANAMTRLPSVVAAARAAEADALSKAWAREGPAVCSALSAATPLPPMLHALVVEYAVCLAPSLYRHSEQKTHAFGPVGARTSAVPQAVPLLRGAVCPVSLRACNWLWRVRVGLPAPAPALAAAASPQKSPRHGAVDPTDGVEAMRFATRSGDAWILQHQPSFAVGLMRADDFARSFGAGSLPIWVSVCNRISTTPACLLVMPPAPAPNAVPQPCTTAWLWLSTGDAVRAGRLERRGDPPVFPLFKSPSAAAVAAAASDAAASASASIAAAAATMHPAARSGRDVAAVRDGSVVTVTCYPARGTVDIEIDGLSVPRALTDVHDMTEMYPYFAVREGVTLTLL